MDLYIYQNFNNYFNREVKKYETLAEYGGAYFTQANVNFKPNDGVNTILTIGGNTEYDGSGDYLIAANEQKVIQSRWFIIDQRRNRTGQFEVTLRRDLFADFYKSFMDNSTIYLEKGWINNLSNPLLFNNERFEPNQIKTKETLIKDKSKCMWLVGYTDKSTETFWKGPGGDTEPDYMRTEISGNIRRDLEVSSWSAWDLYKYLNVSVNSVAKTASIAGGKWKAPENIQVKRTRTGDLQGTDIYIANKNGFVAYEGVRLGGTSAAKSWAKKYVEKYNDIEATIAVGNTKLKADMTLQQYEELLALDGKIIYSQNPADVPRYITIKARNISPLSSWPTATAIEITESNAPEGRELLAGIESAGLNGTQSFTATTQYIGIEVSGTVLYNTTANISFKNYKWYVGKAGHAHLTHESYDMFAIPIATEEAKSFHLKKDGESLWVQGKEQAAFSVAQRLIEKAANGGYDLQLVPFSPLEDSYIGEDSSGVTIDVSTLSDGFDYSIIRAIDNTAYGCIFWLTKNSFSHTIEDVKIANETTAMDIKAANQLDIYHLSSGDYSSSFEFSPVRNRGVNSFRVDCTYKPYHPYIRVCPVFNPNGLYGKDFNDTRGLVCSGTNFSISRGGNEWATYERNNLNYQNAWKREMDYMDSMHGYETAGNIINAITGAGGAGVGVGIATASLGGGIAAGVFSAAAGTADVIISEKQYQLGRDNQIAAYNENIANIKARPNTLSATGANTKNNKIFPILVYYTCTPEEREMFNLTLENYGMTINCLTNNIKDYINTDTDDEGNYKRTYIKGQLIRLNEINEDNHLVYELAQELATGIYMKGVIADDTTGT